MEQDSSEARRPYQIRLLRSERMLLQRAAELVQFGGWSTFARNRALHDARKVLRNAGELPAEEELVSLPGGLSRGTSNE